jgi:type II secretory pathway pseudopilin PulG
VLAVLIVIAVICLLGAFVALAFGGQRRFNEVERFHRASRMTTEWARAGVTKPLLAEQHTPSEERARSDA